MCLKCRELDSRNVYSSSFHSHSGSFLSCLALKTSRIKVSERPTFFSPAMSTLEIITWENFSGASQHLAALPKA